MEGARFILVRAEHPYFQLIEGGEAPKSLYQGGSGDYKLYSGVLAKSWLNGAPTFWSSPALLLLLFVLMGSCPSQCVWLPQDLSPLFRFALRLSSLFYRLGEGSASGGFPGKEP